MSKKFALSFVIAFGVLSVCMEMLSCQEVRAFRRSLDDLSLSIINSARVLAQRYRDEARLLAERCTWQKKVNRMLSEQEEARLQMVYDEHEERLAMVSELQCASARLREADRLRTEIAAKRAHVLEIACRRLREIEY